MQPIFSQSDFETSFTDLQTKISNKEQSILTYEAEIYYFFSENMTMIQNLLNIADWKSAFLILKKMEKIIGLIFNRFKVYDEAKFPIKEIFSEFIDASRDMSSLDLNKVINQKVEIPSKDAICHENKNINFFFEKILRFSVFVINNIGLLFVLKDKTTHGFQYLARILFIRLKTLNSMLAVFHLGVIEINLAFIMFNLEKYDLANIFMNRALKNLEFLKNKGKDENEHMEKKNDLLCILDYIENEEMKNKTKGRTNDLLEMGYYLYSKILDKLNKKNEAETIRKRSKLLKNGEEEEKSDMKNYQTVKNSFPSKRPSSAVRNSAPEDNFSSASFKTAKSNFTMENDLISKENIVYQKYIEVNKNKYKIIILQIPEYSCIEILLYCKPREFLRKVFLGFDQVINLSKTLEGNVLADESSLNSLFKSLAKKLYVRDDELFIKDLEYFHTLNDLLKKK